MNIFRKSAKLILRMWYRRKFKSCGKNFSWDPLSTVFVKPERAEIGDNVFIGADSHISVHDSLKIGDGAMLGPRLMIIGGDHEFEKVGKRLHGQKGGVNLPVTVGKDVWVGASVIILKGVTIEEGSVIGAGSLVSHDIPPYTISFGRPAKPYKKRFSDEELLRHLELLEYDRKSIDRLIEARSRYFDEP